MARAALADLDEAQGHHHRAAVGYEEPLAALPLSRELGDSQALLTALMGLATLNADDGQASRGSPAPYLAEALPLARSLGDTGSEANAALLLYSSAITEQRELAMASMPVVLAVGCERGDRAGELTARLVLTERAAPRDPPAAITGFVRALALAEELVGTGGRPGRSPLRVGKPPRQPE